MLKIGLIREGKIPQDNRVALTPAHCKWLHIHFDDVKVVAQQSENRCYTDKEYERAGVLVTENLDDCNLLLGIKEVPVDMLLEDKRYMFFSHTKKLQPANKKLFKSLLKKNNTLIDYECLEHADGTRIIGFGFFAGIVGAHNGMMAYGNRTGTFKLQRVGSVNSFQKLIHTLHRSFVGCLNFNGKDGMFFLENIINFGIAIGTFSMPIIQIFVLK